MTQAILNPNNSPTNDTIPFSVSGTITNNDTLTIDGSRVIAVDGNHASRKLDETYKGH